MPPIADFTLGHALVTVVTIFLFFAWIYVLITVIADLFADHDMSGWGKALWILALIVLPLLGVLVYLIARGAGMRERAIAAAEQNQKQMDSYIRRTAAASSPAEELGKLSDLKDRGAISDQEFERAKAKLLD